MLTQLIVVLVILAILCLVVWVGKAVLAQIGAPHVAFVILTAIACIVALIFVLQAFGAAIPGL